MIVNIIDYSLEKKKVMMVILMYNIVVFTVIVLCLNCKVNIRKWKLQYFLSYPPCVFGTLTLSLGKAIILIFLKQSHCPPTIQPQGFIYHLQHFEVSVIFKRVCQTQLCRGFLQERNGGGKSPMYY